MDYYEFKQFLTEFFNDHPEIDKWNCSIKLENNHLNVHTSTGVYTLLC